MNDEEEGQQYIDREWEAHKLKEERLHDLKMKKADRKGVPTDGVVFIAIAAAITSFGITCTVQRNMGESEELVQVRLDLCRSTVQNLVRHSE